MHTAQLAYHKTQMQTMSGRDLEASVLTKAALALKECHDNWDADHRDAKLDEALKFNQLVWTIFQTELAREDNPLPKKVRQDILVLSAFIDRRIFEIIAYPAPEKLAAIIDINLNIAAGLRGSPAPGPQ